LKQKKVDFQKKVQELSDKVKLLRDQGGFFLIKTVPKTVQGMMAQIKEYNEEMKEINNKDLLVGNAKMEFMLLEQTQKEMIPYETLWNLAIDWENKSKVWQASNIFKLDPEEIKKEVKTMLGQSSV